MKPEELLMKTCLIPPEKQKEMIVALVTTADNYGKEYYVSYFTKKGNKHRKKVADLDVIKVIEDDPAIMKAYKLSQLNNLNNLLYNGYRIGSDPEAFVVDKDGKVIPAFAFLPSQKDAKRFPDRTGKTKQIYWDGLQAEFTVAPDNCLAWVSDSIQLGLKGLYQEAKKFDPEARISIMSTIDTPIEMIAKFEEKYVQFGCMPSFNIYNMKGKEVEGKDVPFRMAGGHIHFGCGKLNKEQLDGGVKALDAILGVACVSLFAEFDDPKRRELYGLAGEYRLPAHGLEYRTLSNAWLCHPLITNVVFDLARKAFNFGKLGFLQYWEGNVEETIKCINTCDVEKAREILVRNKDLFCKILATCYPDKYETVFELYMKGIGGAIKDPHDVVKNWNLEKAWTTHCDGAGKCVARWESKTLGIKTKT